MFILRLLYPTCLGQICVSKNVRRRILATRLPRLRGWTPAVAWILQGTTTKQLQVGLWAQQPELGSRELGISKWWQGTAVWWFRIWFSMMFLMGKSVQCCLMFFEPYPMLMATQLLSVAVFDVIRSCSHQCHYSLVGFGSKAKAKLLEA